jgi:hypothetical protein
MIFTSILVAVIAISFKAILLSALLSQTSVLSVFPGNNDLASWSNIDRRWCEFQQVLFVVTVFFGLVWFYQATENNWTFVATNHRSSPDLAVLSFLLPPLFFWLPLRIMKEIYSGVEAARDYWFSRGRSIHAGRLTFNSSERFCLWFSCLSLVLFYFVTNYWQRQGIEIHLMFIVQIASQFLYMFILFMVFLHTKDISFQHDCIHAVEHETEVTVSAVMPLLNQGAPHV